MLIGPAQSLGEILTDLRECAGELRRFQKFKEAFRVEAIANKLDPNEIKPGPIVPRSISG